MTELAFYVVSDVHGYIFPTDYQQAHQSLPMGLLQAKQTIDQDRLQHKHTLLIDNGDFLQGSPFCSYLSSHLNSSKPLTDIYNDMRFDVGIVGNHEFNFGMRYLKDTLQQLNYPVLCENILKNDQPFTGEGVTYIKQAGIQIGIIGLTTQFIPNWEQPQHIKELTFESAKQGLQRVLPKVRQQADIVVVCYHGGFEKDIHTGATTELLTGENEGYDLLTEFEGIDVLITGHQHQTIAEVINGIPVIQPGTKGQHVGKITLDITESSVSNMDEVGAHHATNKRVVRHAKSELLPVTGKHPLILTDAQKSLDNDVETWLDTKIASLHEPMRIDNHFEARKQPHPFINLLNYILLEVSEADISSTALFDTATGFDTTVTMRDVINNYPFPNTFNVLAMSGHEIKASLEKSAAYFDIENGEVVVSPTSIKPKPQHFNYDMYGGIYYEIHVNAPVGDRVKNILFKGEPMDMSATYTIVLNNYRAVGGGGYTMFSSDKIVKDIQTEGAQLIIDYLTQHPDVNVPTVTDFKVLK